MTSNYYSGNNMWNTTNASTLTYSTSSSNVATTYDQWIYNSPPPPPQINVHMDQLQSYQVHNQDMLVLQARFAVSSLELMRANLKQGDLESRLKQLFEGNVIEALNPTYKAAPREFNTYINASDLLDEFIRFLGTEGVKQGEVMDLPLELFIKWLIVRSCEADGEEPPLQLPPVKKCLAKPQPRCVKCQRYMRKEIVVPLHAVCAPLVLV